MTENQLERKIAKEASRLLNKKFTKDNLMEWRLGKCDVSEMDFREGDYYLWIVYMNITCIMNDTKL